MTQNKKIQIPKWLPTESIQFIFHIIENNGGEARLVGGCVRDIIIGKEQYDIDIATTITPDSLIKLFESTKNKLHASSSITHTKTDAKKLNVIPTGIKHGTVTIVYNNLSFEITTLRSDVECYGRDAKVEYTTDWIEDSKRRDFTINAMYLDLDGNLYDYHNGIEDLENRKVRFIGDPNRRIQEDYLRILRYFRFISYFGVKNLDQNSLSAIKPNLGSLNDISGERIQQEFKKLLIGDYAIKSLILMDKLGVLNVIFGSSFKKKLSLQFVEPKDFAPALAAFLHNFDGDTELLVRRFREKLKLSNDHYKFIKFASQSVNKYQDTEMFHKKHRYLYGTEHYSLFLQFVSNIKLEHKFQCNNWVPPKFPIKSSDLMKLGFTNKALGDMLKQLEQKWIDSNFTVSKESLLSAARSDEISILT